jgi:formiminotetrahydrofolate cyclodeaminase
LDSTFAKKLFFNKEKYEMYQKEIDKSHNEIKKVESFEDLLSSEIDNDARARISDSMNELRQIFKLEEGN